MAKRDSPKKPEDFIVPLNMNGLEGRMLRMPAPRRHAGREILVVYGHHSSIERWWGFAQNLNKYAAVTMPDLPGFGGMESLYKIGKKPDLDTMADYLASFVKWRYKRSKVTIVGLSFGFLVTTRMLQRYPELIKKVEVLVSAVGFAHYDDFSFSPTRRKLYLLAARFFAQRLPALFFRYGLLNHWVLNAGYKHMHNGKKKFVGVDAETSKKLMAMEQILWHSNDMRTHMYTTAVMLSANNCNQRVDLPVWHVSAGADQYFDANRVEQHMRVIFSEFNEAKNKSKMHAPSVIADAKETAAFIPPKLRRALLALK